MNEELFYEALNETKNQFNTVALNDAVEELVELFDPEMSWFSFVYICITNIIQYMKNKEETKARFYQTFLANFIEKSSQKAWN